MCLVQMSKPFWEIKLHYTVGLGFLFRRGVLFRLVTGFKGGFLATSTWPLMQRLLRFSNCKIARTQLQKFIQGRGCVDTPDSGSLFLLWKSFCPSLREIQLDHSATRYQISTIVADRTAAWTDDVMDEEEVGILCYMNTIPGFRGTLKQRYSDFVVNEIDLTGQVVRLTSLTPPPDKPSSEDRVSHTKEPQVAQESELATEKPVLGEADHIEAFKALVGEEDANQLRDLLAKIDEKIELKNLPPILLTPDSDKAHRAAVHNFFKSRLPQLVTDTVDGPGLATEKCVRIRYFAGGDGGGSRRDRGNKRNGDWNETRLKRQKRDHSDSAPFDSRGRDDWSRPKFLKFHLFKENKNTQDALMILGRMLGVQPKSFSFAGTKDKRAITTQQVTVYKQPAAKVAALNKRLMGMKVGDFSYVDKSLGLGELSGNLFTITLRNVIAERDSAISDAAESLKERGFVNYYGLQRFGSGSVPTHRVGAALLRGEWQTAVDLVLQPRDGEMPEIAEARKYYARTHDIDGALQKFPRQMGSERALLSGLKKHPGNPLIAFGCIPRTMRLMFVHSYQSFIWNHAVSHRLKTYGVDKVAEGDLVYTEDVEEGTHSEGVQSYVKSEEVDVVGAEVGAEDDVDIPDETLDLGSEVLSKVKYVTAEDVLSNKYTITDIVLPLPGSSVIYPKNSTADVYLERASKDSVDLTKCSHKVKDYSILHMRGGYRRVVQKPENFEWKIIRYDDVTQSLVESDLDALTKASEERPSPSAVEGAFKALQLRFSLQTSSYATMAIRELLKSSTSVAFHKTLNEELVK